MSKTLEQAKIAALISFQVTGGKFGVIADPDDEGFYMSIPVAQHHPETDPPMIYQTPKGKIY